jgi:hypothetical protein
VVIGGYKTARKWGTEVFLAGWHHDALQPPLSERTNMLTLSAMIYNTARLGFEAQNAMAFRFLRMVNNAAKSATPPASTLNLLLPPVPFLSDTELVDPSPVAAPVSHTQRASVSKAATKTTRDKKRSKRRTTSRR